MHRGGGGGGGGYVSLLEIFGMCISLSHAI